jgi:hypothetical protein
MNYRHGDTEIRGHGDFFLRVSVSPRLRVVTV